MKVTVKEYLNVRVGKPSVNAPCFQYLAPGSEIEVDGKLYKGDAFEHVDTWLKDATNNYYWSGGIEKSMADLVKRPNFWFDHFAIREIWKEEKGDRSTILILDSGINSKLPVFRGRIREPVMNFAVNSSTTTSNDNSAHGTHCAALIAARATEYTIGAAPEAMLYVGKVTENGELDDATTLKTALKEFLKDKYTFDVISISQCIVDDDSELNALLQKHVDKKRIIFASIGNDSQSRNSNKKRYPGFYDNCISVGACENNGSLSNYTCFPDKVNIFCYGTGINSYKHGTEPEPLTGTSQATAIVSGICALIISFLKKNQIDYDQESIRSLLQKYSGGLIGFPQYRLIQPQLVFKNLIKLKNDGKKSLQTFITDSIVIS